jgi:hypothetical protein
MPTTIGWTPEVVMGNDTFEVFVSCARTDGRHASDIVAGLQARGLTFFLSPVFGRDRRSFGDFIERPV